MHAEHHDLPLQIFKEIGGEEWSNLGALRHCMGDINEDRTSDILDREMVGQRGDEKVRFSVSFESP